MDKSEVNPRDYPCGITNRVNQQQCDQPKILWEFADTDMFEFDGSTFGLKA
jgi:hypothetical protein